MKPSQLLDHFDRISEAPDAVPRLRMFILDLAVRGKLVEQNQKDEPASELLKRIHVEKERILRAGGMRKEKALPPLVEDRLPYRVPKNWRWSQLGEIGFLNPRNSAADDLPASFVPMPLISAEYGVACKYEVRPWGEIKSGYTHFAEGDVGLAKITPCFENGKSAVFRGLSGGLGAGTTELHIVRPVFINADYALIFLKSPHFIESGLPRMTGTAGQKRVPTEYFAHSPFPLPPLAEQHRIVVKVDELMALCDRLGVAQAERERSRDRLTAASLDRLNQPADAGDGAAFREHVRFHISHLARFTTRPDQIPAMRQAILNLAVCGQLVQHDPGEQSATALLSELREAKDRLQVEENIRSRQPVPRTARSELGFVIPGSWELPVFDDVLVIAGGITKGRNLAGRRTLEVPYLRVANVQRGYLDLSVMKTIRVPDDELSRYALRSGDVLLTEGGDWDKLGRAAIWRNELRQCIHQNHVFRARAALPEKLDARWVVTYTNSLLGRRYFEKASKQTTNLASINMTQLRGCPLPLPPLAEQRRIVDKVVELMAVCDRLEMQLVAVQTESRLLLEAVLHEALVPAA